MRQTLLVLNISLWVHWCFRFHYSLLNCVFSNPTTLAMPDFLNLIKFISMCVCVWRVSKTVWASVTAHTKEPMIMPPTPHINPQCMPQYWWDFPFLFIFRLTHIRNFHTKVVHTYKSDQQSMERVLLFVYACWVEGWFRGIPYRIQMNTFMAIYGVVD